jgi:hypothetical protein
MHHLGYHDEESPVFNTAEEQARWWAKRYEELLGKPATPSSLYGWVGRRYGVWPSRKLLEEVLAPTFEAEPEVSASEVEAWAAMRAHESFATPKSTGLVDKMLQAVMEGGEVPPLDLMRQAEDARPTVEGYTVPEADGDISNIWQFAATGYGKVEAKAALKAAQRITFPASEEGRAVAFAFLADPHFGNPGTDYARAKADADLIAATDGMYAGTMGDITDNWIVGKLTALQRNQSIAMALEKKLANDWLNILLPKLLFFVAGNHDLWTVKMSGVDPYKEYLAGKEVLYDEHEAQFDLHLPDGTSQNVLGRHQYKGKSDLNPTHGIEKVWEHYDYDIALGAHLHPFSMCREFVKRGKRRYAVQLGTYKRHDDYAREIGYPPTEGVGSGAFVFAPNAAPQWFNDIRVAAAFLRYLREKA